MLRTGLTQDLIKKYSVPGPRYTSYPTAVEFTSSFTSMEWEEELRAPSPTNGNSSLYLHIPYCPSLCLFCACHKIITQDRAVVEPYLNALRRELELYRDILGGDITIEQVHLGGGSPNYLDANELTELYDSIARTFPRKVSDADISIELDPRTTTTEQLTALHRAGVNRLSMGVQDFDSTVQAAVNREQSFAMTEKLVVEARSLGIRSVGIDLIYGLPSQTLRGFEATLQKVIDLSPDRIALYGYAHVTWKVKVQKSLPGRGDMPTPDERIQLLLLAIERLSDAGYEFIGMDHFARPHDQLYRASLNGTLHRNFMGYSTHRGVKLFGLGASAISSTAGAFAQNFKEIPVYQSKIADGVLPIERGITRSRSDQIRGEIIETLLCRGSINIREIEVRWGISFYETFETPLRSLGRFLDDGLVEIRAGEIALTQIGRFFMRNIAMVFDEYLDKYASNSQRVFSQAV